MLSSHSQAGVPAVARDGRRPARSLERLQHITIRSAKRRASAASAAAGQGAPAAAPHSPALLLALKEWAPTCAAIAAGEQTILLRKGGIKEPTFKPAARDFVLFPTSFHTDVKLLRPTAAKRYAAETAYDPRAQRRLEFATAARVTGAWTTMDPAVLQLLDELHVWAPGFLENRLRWRPRQPITVLEVRAYRLAQPLLLEPRDEFWGCFSWVLLDEAAQQGLEEAPSGGPPALDDAAFAERQELCRQQLAQLPDLQELALDAL